MREDVEAAERQLQVLLLTDEPFLLSCAEDGPAVWG